MTLKTQKVKVPFAEIDPSPFWKQIALIGTEQEGLEQIAHENWYFAHLEKEIDEGLLENGNIWLFGATEGLSHPDDDTVVLMVPVIFGIQCDICPITEIGVTSVQMEKERLIPLSQLKMEWIPYLPPSGDPTQSFTRINVLNCRQRRTSAKRLTIEALNEFTYAIPHMYNPFRAAVDDDDNTIATGAITVKGELKPYEIDYKFQTPKDVVDDLMEEYEIPPEQRKEIEDNVNNAITNAKAKRKAEKDEEAKRKKALSPAVTKALKAMKIYKFYPSNWKGGKSSFVNRYIGKADKIVEPVGIEHVTFPSTKPFVAPPQIDSGYEEIVPQKRQSSTKTKKPKKIYAKRLARRDFELSPILTRRRNRDAEASSSN
ncbi:putative Protein HEAT INTOLERANT 4 [Blattamonas nauphoetae]|uniref:Uncharacterized protein n=1 Tax=Blattamonas nauphoetae TaxID=2049346 RepID=A0ABQ9Y6K5_9EUKA|nr:putative Protein HEAT INTOLERANT 4 [Blattamonas nauphoetae]